MTGLTAVGLALRLAELGQGLWGDELLAHQDIDQSFGSVMDALRNGLENSPPLYFVLAWLSSKLGNDPALIRLPSLILGTALIPLVALLGARTVGRWAGVAAAGFMALSPFAIYYSVEARPYITLMFMCVLSVLALLTALERCGRGWWVLYGLSLAGVLYSHYTGLFVVAAQIAWALWAARAPRRDLLIAIACSALAFAPWLPFVKGERLDVYGDVARILGLTYLDAAVTWLVGLPFLSPGEMPGAVVLILLALALAVGLAYVPWRAVRRLPLRSPAALIGILALATPVGVLGYSLFSYDLFAFPRNLLASLPFAALMIGWVLLRPPRPLAGVALGLMGVALLIGAAMTLEDERSRPDYPQAADYVDRMASPSRRVVYAPPGTTGVGLSNGLRLYFHHSHPAVFEPDPHRWAELGSGRVVVVGQSSVGESAQPIPPAHGLVRVAERLFPGITPIAVAVYRHDPLEGPGSYALRGDQLVPAAGAPLPIHPTGVEGLVEFPKAASGNTLKFTGWAHRDHHPVDKVIAFVGDEVVYADAPDQPRPDLSRPPNALGFQFEVPRSRIARGEKVTAYALIGGEAFKLGSYCDPEGTVVPCPAAR